MTYSHEKLNTEGRKKKKTNNNTQFKAMREMERMLSLFEPSTPIKLVTVFLRQRDESQLGRLWKKSRIGCVYTDPPRLCEAQMMKEAKGFPTKEKRRGRRARTVRNTVGAECVELAV